MVLLHLLDPFSNNPQGALRTDTAWDLFQFYFHSSTVDLRTSLSFFTFIISSFLAQLISFWLTFCHVFHFVSQHALSFHSLFCSFFRCISWMRWVSRAFTYFARSLLSLGYVKVSFMSFLCVYILVRILPWLFASIIAVCFVSKDKETINQKVVILWAF